MSKQREYEGKIYELKLAELDGTSCSNCSFRFSGCSDMSMYCGDSGYFAPAEQSQAEPVAQLESIPEQGGIKLGEVRSYHVGNSDYSKHKIQPWDIWLEYNLNPWDADIVKRVLRQKQGDSRQMDYEKIIHICQERIRQLNLKENM
jgi:hypothetical protein